MQDNRQFMKLVMQQSTFCNYLNWALKILLNDTIFL